MQRILSDLSEDVELMSSDAMLSVKVEHLERMLDYIHELEVSKRQTLEYIKELQSQGELLDYEL